MKKIFTILTLLIFTAITAFAQTTTVKGFVFDEAGIGLIGTIISLSNDKEIGITDVDGRFEIEVPIGETYLKISYLGFVTEKMYIICTDCEHKIQLKESTEILGEVISISCYSRPKVFSSIETIDLKPIQTNNSTNLLPLLNSLTGVYVHSGALNTNRIIVRGVGARSPFSTRNIKMYYNDIPITSGDGESLMEDLDVSSFDRVDVLKGPSNSLIGAPLGGGIFLVNYKHISKSSFTTDMSVGSYGLWRNANRFELSLKKASIKLFQNTTLSDGYRQNNEYVRRSAGIEGKVDLNYDHDLSFIAHYTQLFGEVPSSINEDDYLNAPEKAAFNWLATEGHEDYNRVILGVNHRYNGKGIDISNSLFSNFRNNYEVRPFNILNEKVSNVGWRPSVNYTNYDWNDLDWTTGAELLFEKYEWQTYENENNGEQGEQIANNLENRQYINLFSQAKIIPFDDFVLIGGVNFNKTQYQLEDLFVTDTIDQSGNHAYDWIFSPRIGVNYRFNYNFELFASISHGFSMPSVEETLLSNGLINPNLKPETGWSYEIGAKGYIEKTNISYEVALYRMAIQNLIVADRIDADTYIGINAGATQHDGIETKLAYYYNGLSINANYSLNNYTFKDFVDDGNDYSGNKLTGVPSNTFNGNIRYQNYKIPIYATLTYRFVDAIPIFDDNSLFTESYQLLDFKTGYDYEFKKLTISAYLGINNLTNEKYASMIAINPRSFGGNAPRIYYPGLPRNVYGGIKIRMEMYGDLEKKFK